MERFSRLAQESLNQIFQGQLTGVELELPPDPSLGDFALPCFKFSKLFRKSPQQIAQDVVSELLNSKKTPHGMSVQAVGPYVNFTVHIEELWRTLLPDILKGEGLGDYGSISDCSRGCWVLEYSSPNVAKPLNIYHLRPTVLGAALDRIGRYRGFRVVSINHLGDWGKQYGMLVVAFRLFNKTIDSSFTMSELVELYVKVNALADQDPSLEEEARMAFLKLEQNDPEVTALWKKCVEISLQEFHKSYLRLGVKFDYYWGESFYKDRLMPLLSELEQRGLLIESEGAWLVPVTDEAGNELVPCLLKKKDGATLYATRDIASALYRYEQFHFDRMTYIVGADQILHFKQVFGVLKKMGLDWRKKCEHIPFGLYRFRDAKMSTRKGNFVTLEEVLGLAKERVLGLIQQRSKGVFFTPEEREETAEAIAIGAVVFHDLHVDPLRDVEFDLERVVDFEGETGPYLQYAFTRCQSLLKKSGFKNSNFNHTVQAEELRLLGEVEIRLLKILGFFPFYLEKSLTEAKASLLANYLIQIAKNFSIFYRECPVLSGGSTLAEETETQKKIKNDRLMLVEATSRVLGRGLELLGIPRPQKM